MRNPAQVAAIVCAYNEDRHIRTVLDTLVLCDFISEIVVVDDGSREPLTRLQYVYPSIHFIRHAENRGKAYAMETGVSSTRAPYIFFCDADLVGFLPEHARAIIEPVIAGDFESFVGIRHNREQRAVFLFALNSGERCLKRSLWEALPPFYKKGFRIETGLNFQVKKMGGRIGWRLFPYRNTLREQKYGFWEGFRGRLVLSFDVFVAWMFIIGFDLWRR
ncbi:MAG: hypothetical protein A3C06_04290 [Candidatus Taylorbacteria bacterium RIFCSPHIGHO2_02_FULL_46_13]|uniref:Glycosyltransferase 2-like domain-containing protein n=1 Tax=Candidatus Taylorbacteria bacterium RIFCSPHIGHO2_02_FULL_46_13 TaxID=1802312 RepID=A0A1G2MVI8_9BACT|nr:MAG: hypothetical protein A3C06_04290 [Candidatus Taylorbacteria bacterium RIFCSPHIGHO2_02_FULL_46_13]